MTAADLLRHADLAPSHRVLLVGTPEHLVRELCGLGCPLLALDHDLALVRRYRVAHPAARFRQLRFYHPQLRRRGCARVRLPAADSGYDLVVVPELGRRLRFGWFNRLVPELSRVCRPGGKMALSCKLLNYLSMGKHGESDYLPYRTPGGWHSSRQCPTAQVALPEIGVRRALMTHRLQPCDPVRYGRWCDGPNPVGEDDLLVARRV